MTQHLKREPAWKRWNPGDRIVNCFTGTRGTVRQLLVNGIMYQPDGSDRLAFLCYGSFEKE